ncbi:SGNH_hydrolase domain containing protein [uncultured Caudovirales phage]|uniref:SGNH_hydrolase domain containing protein n=1 Tax=uncultured Caudovirales phage TaxID=2100421 RepID=A0A6J5TBB2_9CAUD|nr:SGNH_hydrolase domain containing protein [uncultured Caudovirales phage]
MTDISVTVDRGVQGPTGATGTGALVLPTQYASVAALNAVAVGTTVSGITVAAGISAYVTGVGMFVNNGTAWYPSGFQIPGTYTFATLPAASTVPNGMRALTSDKGWVRCNGSTAWTTEDARTSGGVAKVALIGDSLIDNTFPANQVNPAPGSFVVTGGPANPVATIKVDYQQLNAGIGMRIVVRNAGDINSTDVLNGANVQLTAVDHTNFIYQFVPTYAGQTMANGDYSKGISQGVYTTLAASITTTGAQSVSLASGANFTTRGVVKIDNEEMYYDTISGATLTVTQRGINGTAAATHLSGASVTFYKPWEVKNTSFELASGNVWAFLKGALRGRFAAAVSYAVGGSTSSVGVALLPKIVGGAAFDYAFIQYGTNDCKSVTTAAAAQSSATSALNNIKAIANSIIANTTAQVIIGTPPPVNSTASRAGSAYSNYANMAIAQLRKGILQFASGNARVRVFDHYADYTDTTGEPIANYIANGNATVGNDVDNVHPSVFGAMASSQKRLTAILADPSFYGPLPITSTISAYDDATTYPQGSTPQSNICKNPIFAGTGGSGSSSGGTFSGTVSTGWTITGSGGCAITAASGAALADTANPYWGFGLNIATTFTSQSQSWTLTSTQYASSMVSGNWYQGRILVTATSDFNAWPCVLRGMQFQFYTNQFAQYAPNFQATSSAYMENGFPMKSGQSMWLLSEPFYYAPGTTVSSAILQLFAYANSSNLYTYGSGTFNIQVSNASVNIVNAPY